MAKLTLSEIPSKEQFPGYHGKFIHMKGMTVVYWTVEEGASVPLHTHPHEQIATIESGEFELIVDGERFVMTPGTIITIPSNVPHEGTALTPCKLIDIFQPVREEYR